MTMKNHLHLPASALLAVLTLTPHPHLLSTAQDSTEYTRYTKYHPYCSTPEQMAQRSIPQLNYTNTSATPQIIHVTALIRHGARTPWSGAPAYSCWSDYWTDPSTAIWDCNLKTYMAPPPDKSRAKTDSDGTLVQEEADFLFEKRYDALVYRNGSGNELNGTCQLGQLLMRGYEQELLNGQHLRQTYFYNGTNTSLPSMRLWDMTATLEQISQQTSIVGDTSKPIYQEPNLVYRADDEQRTLMSGQVLLRGLFGPEISAGEETTVIKVHTGDYKKDILVINKNVCPRAMDLEAEAYESEEFREWNETSVEVQIIRKFAESKLGLEKIPGGILDCLMTTMCTDRPLPELLDDYDGSLGPTPWKEEGSEGIAIVSEKDFTNIFERLVNYAVKQGTFPYKYNDAALPKLGMGPLWKEIMTNILPIIGSDTNYTYDQRTPPKLALFSGHDTTLMPILATLGNEVWNGIEWTPYASMILIEIYEMLNNDPLEFPSGYSFRLIYNGEVLTSKMENCNSDLCDSKALLDQVMPFAKYEERDCAPLDPTEEESGEFDDSEEDTIPEPKQSATSSEVQPRQKWLMFGVALMSAAIGSLATCFMMRHHYQQLFYKQASGFERELSLVEPREGEYEGSNGGGGGGGGVNATVSPDYVEESDEDRII